jgi:hypothetical protein
MKKILFTLAIGLATLMSCESDLVNRPPAPDGTLDDTVGETTGDLVGSWRMISLNYEGTSVTSVQGTDFTADFVGVGSDYNYEIEFTEAPNNFSSTGTYDIELTTTIAGQTTVNNEDDLDASSNGSWDKNANVLTLTNNSQTNDADIQILSDTTLKFTVTEETSISEQGVNAETSVTTVSIFERL